ncbi:MAG: acetyl-CoA carboxylase, biotin carboxyl carrier protein [Legionellales bacterium]|nr:acetyl-CoA carboxylase, biotin carboxyl carrier protein [Legionellales bacterium]
MSNTTNPIQKLAEVIEFAEEKNLKLQEIEVKDQDGSGLRITLQSSVPVVAAPGPAVLSHPTAPVSTPSTDDTQTESGTAIKSPMVGTAYLTPSPDAEPFIKVGQSVSAGQTICLIEAMKMFNKIKAETSGTVKKILIESGQPVEFDQPLVILED